jgi:hypothetical protein
MELVVYTELPDVIDTLTQGACKVKTTVRVLQC